MKFADINRQFTEIAESYLDHGYHINTATMGPSSGEVAHLDLTNGSVVIRIVLQSFFKDDDFYNEGYELMTAVHLARKDSSVPIAVLSQSEIDRRMGKLKRA